MLLLCLDLRQEGDDYLTAHYAYWLFRLYGTKSFRLRELMLRRSVVFVG